MTHTRIVSAGLAALLILAALTSVAMAAQQTSLSLVDPVGYCETATVEATTSGYTVTAEGWGQWAQVIDIASGSVVVRTNFGPGTTTAFAWEGLALVEAAQYQVQVSRYETTGYGYSPNNCMIVPPEPQSVTITRFEIVNGAFEWDATWDGLGYWVKYAGKPVTAWTPAQAPGAWGWFSYRVAPVPTMARSLPLGVYYLWAQDGGATGVAATYTHGGGEPGDND